MRILLVEDDPMLGKATVSGLKTAYAVDWCRSAENAAGALHATDYDLVVLDIGLPGKSGLDLLEEMRGHGNTCPVIFLTARDAVSHRVAGLKAGADDYLVKPFDLDELVARCAALIRRSKGRPSAQIVYEDLVFDPGSRDLRKKGVHVRLSAREMAVLEILFSNLGQIVSKARIEEHIYDWSDEHIESNTIEVHVSAIRRKLGRALIRTVRGLGYVIAP